MVTIDVKKELNVKIQLPELEIEGRVLVTPAGEVEMSFMPWTQWSMSGESFEQMVEDFNLLKSQIKLCVENQAKEQLEAPPKR